MGENSDSGPVHPNDPVNSDLIFPVHQWPVCSQGVSFLQWCSGAPGAGRAALRSSLQDGAAPSAPRRALRAGSERSRVLRQKARLFSGFLHPKPPSRPSLRGRKPLYLFRLTSCAIPRRYLNLSNDQFQSRILNCSLTYNNFGAGIIIWNKIVPTIHYFREITKGKKQTPKQTTKLHAAERKCPRMILFPL